LPDAEDHLAHLWMTAADRSEVTKATDAIDAQLRTSPLDVGEAATGIYRVLVVEPLVVAYKVVDADCTVTVISVIRKA
jgi:hypothetical protein